ncbi:MAG: ABC transporter ATP-binding protein [Clostridia bacterium]|nr:ABC transporter ATP-binding protein [Clostridia bacterium]
MLEVKELTKKYSKKTAVDGLSFSVGDNEIVGLLGPNGAGKTTTMNMITGFTAPTSGSVEIDGTDMAKDPIAAKAKLGYLPEQPPVYPEMTVREYLRFVAELKGVKKSRVDAAAKEASVSSVINRRIGNLSKGYIQRAGLAAALLGDAKVIILDEPTVGLDPNQLIEMRNLIKRLGKTHTVILSSHILSEISEVCGRVIIMNEGKIAADVAVDKNDKELEKLFVRLTGKEEGTEDDSDTKA